MTLHTRPTTVAEVDELLARVQQARRECRPAETVLRREYDDTIDELLAIRTALTPAQREPTE
jgi:hypothetical protein